MKADEATQRTVLMHEISHIALGHLDTASDELSTEQKLIIDNDYEVAADSYTVENGADPKVFLDVIESSKQVFNEYVSNVDEETRTNIENDPTYKLIMEQFDRRIDNLNKML